MGLVLAPAAFSAAVVLAAMPGTLRMLRRLGARKMVRPEGPAHHQVKAGTPTMGGVVIVGAVAAATLIWVPRLGWAMAAVGVWVGYALLGVADDLRALLQHRSMGLRAREKFAGEVALAVVFAIWAWRAIPEAGRLFVPFSEAQVGLGLVAHLLVTVLATVGAANAVNLTDGLDGLAAGSSLLAAVGFVLVALAGGHPEAAVFGAAVAGACGGFLWFNGHPAAVFMGDTGSLALGSAMAVLAVTTSTTLALPLIGGLFVVETLSVIVQVVYFKATGGRRLFRMSPLHHHFELGGWPEPQVVVRLWLVAAAFAVLGVWSILG